MTGGLTMLVHLRVSPVSSKALLGFVNTSYTDYRKDSSHLTDSTELVAIKKKGFIAKSYQFLIYVIG